MGFVWVCLCLLIGGCGCCWDLGWGFVWLCDCFIGVSVKCLLVCVLYVDVIIGYYSCWLFVCWCGFVIVLGWVCLWFGYVLLLLFVLGLLIGFCWVGWVGLVVCLLVCWVGVWGVDLLVFTFLLILFYY